MDYLHEEEGEVEVLLYPKLHDGHLHKRVKIKHNPERQGGHLHAEEVEDQIPPERHGGHLQAEECEYKVQLITEHIVITCMQKKVKNKFNSTQNTRSTGPIFSLDF